MCGISVHLPVCVSAWNNSVPTGQVSMNFFFLFFENLSRRFKFHKNPPRIAVNLHEDQYTVSIIYRSVLLRMRNSSEKNILEKIKINILCTMPFSRKLCFLWDNTEKYDRSRQATDDNIIGSMRVAFWITKATTTDSEYVIFLAFPQQQWLYERPPLSYYVILPVLLYIIKFFPPKKWSRYKELGGPSILEAGRSHNLVSISRRNQELFY